MSAQEIVTSEYIIDLKTYYELPNGDVFVLFRKKASLCNPESDPQRFFANAVDDHPTIQWQTEVLRGDPIISMPSELPKELNEKKIEFHKFL